MLAKTPTLKNWNILNMRITVKINIIIISHKKDVVRICDKVFTLDKKGLNEI